LGQRFWGCFETKEEGFEIMEADGAEKEGEERADQGNYPIEELFMPCPIDLPAYPEKLVPNNYPDRHMDHIEPIGDLAYPTQGTDLA